MSSLIITSFAFLIAGTKMGAVLAMKIGSHRSH